MSKFVSSDANLGQTKKGYALGENSVHAKEVWNAAIDAVINLTNEKWFIELPSKEIIAICKLKK